MLTVLVVLTWVVVAAAVTAVVALLIRAACIRHPGFYPWNGR
jgi:hypothetical protein